MSGYAIQARQLATVSREIDDPKLHEAVDRLADIAVEADAVDGRFRAQVSQVQALLQDRIGGRR